MNSSIPAGIEAQLGPGERVLWQGKPERGPFVRRTWPLTVFGAVLLASAAAYEYVILTSEAPDLLAVWGVPFLVAALYMSAGHFLVTSREWRNTEYVVTGTRLLIRHGAFSPRVTVYSLLGLPHTRVEMRGPNVGNIMFRPPEGQGYGPYPGYSNMWPYAPGYLVGLLYIKEPEAVQGLIEGARRA